MRVAQAIVVCDERSTSARSPVARTMRARALGLVSPDRAADSRGQVEPRHRHRIEYSDEDRPPAAQSFCQIASGRRRTRTRVRRGQPATVHAALAADIIHPKTSIWVEIDTNLDPRWRDYNSPRSAHVERGGIFLHVPRLLTQFLRFPSPESWPTGSLGRALTLVVGESFPSHPPFWSHHAPTRPHLSPYRTLFEPNHA